MKVFSAEQIHALDRAAEAAGTSASELMRRAEAAVAEVIASRYPSARRVLVMCGPGNNGGDGYGVAANLLAAGVEAAAMEVSSTPGSPAAAGERERYLTAGGDVSPLTPARLAAKLTGDASPDLVVDALFGVGLKRPLAGALAEVVELLEREGATVVSVDVPSGLDADRAAPVGPHVRAEMTVQLAGPKLASLCHPARQAYGEVVTVGIGIDEALLEAGSSTLLLDADEVDAWISAREPDVHKYSAGTVCVIAGSSRYLGAAELACRGAWRAGAGLVTLVAPERFPGGWPETVLVQPRDATWPPPDLTSRQASATVFGPGLDRAGAAWLPAVLAWAPGSVVVDASGLDPEVLPLGEALASGAGARVITPHAGEAARLLETAANEVAADPLGAALELARRHRAVCVLKGPTTVIAAPSGRAALSTYGHPGMAAGGTGDVLAGLLGALLSDPRGSTDAFEVVAAGVVAHGLAGELAAARLGRSLTASDVAESLPQAFRRVLGGRW